MNNETILEESYLEDLDKIKQTIRENQNKVMVVANQGMIITYYQIGTIINKRKKWGNKYIERLSNDLKHLKGYSRSNLFYMKQLADVFTGEEIIHQVGGQIWVSHLQKMKCHIISRKSMKTHGVEVC